MKELSLNILDITQNSITARAKNIGITIDETDETLTVSIKDDGCGMSAEIIEKVTNPFCTTRTTRKVGLGIPFFKLAAEQTGGNITIESRTESDSPHGHGTTITALFYKTSFDFTPLGDIISTLVTIINGCGTADILFIHTINGKKVVLDTLEIRQALGDEVPLYEVEIISWIKAYLEDQYSA